MLSKEFQFTRPLTFPGIGTAGEDAKFAITFRTIPDDELASGLQTMGIGTDAPAMAAQRAFNERVIVSAECPEHFPTPAEATAWLLDAPIGIRSAVRMLYVSNLYGGELAQKN